MKYILIISILIITLFSNSALSQDLVQDTLAIVKVKNTALKSKDTLEFELHIQRNSERWLKFANGTFQLGFENGMNFDVNDMYVMLIGQDIKAQVVTAGNLLPTDGYYIEPKIFKDRISITFLGPPTYDECELINKDSSLLLGKFYLIAKKKNIPDKLMWLEPQNFYQDCAYKLSNDSLRFGFITWFKTEDNVSMDDGIDVTFLLDGNSKTGYNFVHNKFNVIYNGQMNIGLDFSSKTEYRVDGFTILRGIGFDGEKTAFTDSVYTYKTGSKYYNAEMLSKGNTRTGNTYGSLPDVVPFRGGRYDYALYGHYTNSAGIFTDTLLEITSVEVPSAVIVKATANPQVFSDMTTIDYKLDDDVYLTVQVYDLNGKFIKFLPISEIDGPVLNGAEMRKGMHETKFYAPELASQGLYRIIFTAVPIKDPNVEISRAYVDVQLVKGSVQ